MNIKTYARDVNGAAIYGSGVEDIGGPRPARHVDVLGYAVEPPHPTPESAKDAHRLAEDAARNRRLDRDALVHAALCRLEATPITGTTAESATWVSHYTRTLTRRDVRAEEVAALITEIRAELSPLVRGVF